MGDIKELRVILREDACPFFSNEELSYYLEKYPTLEDAAYHCLIVKSENTELSVSGMTAADTSRYFLRLAQMYRRSNSGTLKGG